MHKHKHKRFELKTVTFVPTHAQHERTESKEYERKEHSLGKASFIDNVGKNTRFVKGTEQHMKGKGPAPFTREQFEEHGKELERTNKVTGLWYPHRGK
jgi:hypothetical protein